jgi:hypothetical protein
MPRCAEATCGRWRPDLSGVDRYAATAARRIGALQFNGSWYCSRACVEQAALSGLGDPADARPATSANLTRAAGRDGRGRALPPIKLGVLLRHAGAITQSQLEEALEVKAHTGLKIGEQLAHMGFTDADAVLRALAAQAGVSYLATFDVSRVTRAPVSLAPAMVRALGLVPFEADHAGRRLHVISAAPLPRAAMRAMAKLTGWNLDVYLVRDSVFDAALAAYQPADDIEPASEPTTVGTLTAAAARVADRVQTDRAVTMRHASCDAYVWVRVEGSHHVSDVLVRQGTEALQDLGRRGKGEGCQAELIAH